MRLVFGWIPNDIFRIIRLEKMNSQEQGMFYLLKVPIANLSKKSLQAATNSADRALDIMPQFAYFPDVDTIKDGEFRIKISLTWHPGGELQLDHR